MLLLLALFALALPVDAIPESSGAGSTNFSSVAVPMKVAMALLHLLPSSQPCCAAGVGRLDIVDVPASDEEQVRREWRQDGRTGGVREELSRRRL